MVPSTVNVTQPFGALTLLGIFGDGTNIYAGVAPNGQCSNATVRLLTQLVSTGANHIVGGTIDVAGAYYVCVSYNQGKTWYQQNAVLVVDGTCEWRAQTPRDFASHQTGSCSRHARLCAAYTYLFAVRRKCPEVEELQL